MIRRIYNNDFGSNIEILHLKDATQVRAKAYFGAEKRYKK
jgi:hypothetical protein